MSIQNHGMVEAGILMRDLRALGFNLQLLTKNPMFRTAMRRIWNWIRVRLGFYRDGDVIRLKGLFKKDDGGGGLFRFESKPDKVDDGRLSPDTQTWK